MSLGDFIEKIQHKPKHTRMQILWLCVIVCMVMVVAVWFSTLDNALLFDELSSNNEESIKEVFTEEIPSVKDSLGASVKSLFDTFGDIDKNDIEVQNEVQNNNDYDKHDSSLEIQIEEYELQQVKPGILPVTD